MMTQNELYAELKSIGLPIKYHHYSDPPALPYLIYLFSDSDDFMADNKNYLPISNFDIELYTDKKDIASEKLVEDKLNELKMPYYKSETWIENERLFQVLYEIQIVGG